MAENVQQLFDSLGHQATQMVQIGGELETAQHLNKLVLHVCEEMYRGELSQ